MGRYVRSSQSSRSRAEYPPTRSRGPAELAVGSARLHGSTATGRNPPATRSPYKDRCRLASGRPAFGRPGPCQSATRRYGINPAAPRSASPPGTCSAGVAGTFRLRDAELVVGDPVTSTTGHRRRQLPHRHPKRDTDVVSPKYLDTAAWAPGSPLTGRGSARRRDRCGSLAPPTAASRSRFRPGGGSAPNRRAPTGDGAGRPAPGWPGRWRHHRLVHAGWELAHRPDGVWRATPPWAVPASRTDRDAALSRGP